VSVDGGSSTATNWSVSHVATTRPLHNKSRSSERRWADEIQEAEIDSEAQSFYQKAENKTEGRKAAATQPEAQTGSACSRYTRY
jgi:hypothetical protein